MHPSSVSQHPNGHRPLSGAAAAVLAILMWSCAATSWANAAQLELVGSARLQVLFWPVYDSRLYATDGRYTPDKLPLRLEIEYLRDV